MQVHVTEEVYDRLTGASQDKRLKKTVRQEKLENLLLRTLMNFDMQIGGL